MKNLLIKDFKKVDDILVKALINYGVLKKLTFLAQLDRATAF